MLDPENQSLKDIVLKNKLCSEAQIKEALEEHDRTGRSLKDILVDFQFATEEQILAAIATSLGVDFVDLRDVEMPDRIIDTNAIMMKKSKQTVKDLKELKNVRVDFNEGGINVKVRGDWKDYSIPFDMEGYSAEQKKKFLASTYETFEQQERQTGNETRVRV